MLVNSSLTVYHKTYDEISRLEKWIRYNYDNVWWFGGRGAGISKGYKDANDVEIRIPYDKNTNLNIEKFKIGDILVQGNLETNISTQQDLKKYEVYNITSINDNRFGNNQHIHLGGK